MWPALTKGGQSHWGDHWITGEIPVGNFINLLFLTFCLQRRKRLCKFYRRPMSLASDSSETIDVTIIKLGTVTASDMVMHHVLIILT